MTADVLVLSAGDVERSLPVVECIDAMARALGDLATGDVELPLRSAYRPPSADGNGIVWMPAFRRGDGSRFAAKLVTLAPENRSRGLDRHQGVVTLFDGVTGEPLAVLSAPAITAIRTAAVSALATRMLANRGASTLAVIGAGVQARCHLESIPLVRHIERAVIASRTTAAAEALAERVSSTSGVPVRVAASVQDAVREADIVVTATSSTAPVIDRRWLRAGAHVNAVGTHEELDGATLAASELFTDHRDSIGTEAKDFQRAMRDGLIAADHVRAELGELLADTGRGRSDPAAITVFRSLGLACEDLYAAEHAVRRACELGIGAEVPL